MTRLLVVDDSPLVRKLLVELFEGEGDFEVAVARDGQECLDLLPTFAPDVITLDIQMPRLDGLACLDQIMVLRPTPVVMVSSLSTEGADETVRALGLGAVDVVAKPAGALSLRMDELGPRIVEVVRAAAGARISRARRLSERVRVAHGIRKEPRPLAPMPAQPAPRRAASGDLPGVVLVGSSTGGPPALDAVLGALPQDFAWPVLVAQHMPGTFTGALARRLDTLCALSVAEVTGPTRLEPGHVYVGRGEADLIVSERPGGLVALAAPADDRYRWHPSVDRLTESAMAHLPPERLVGVLLTGMGNDGATSMAALRERGGRTIAEAEETAIVWGMPGELVRAGGASLVRPLDQIGRELVALVAAR